MQNANEPQAPLKSQKLKRKYGPKKHKNGSFRREFFNLFSDPEEHRIWGSKFGDIQRMNETWEKVAQEKEFYGNENYKVAFPELR